MTAAYATRTHTHRGYSIEPCEWADNPHGGRWAIRSVHRQTGIRWSDQECKHTHTLAEAKRYIDEYARFMG